MEHQSGTNGIISLLPGNIASVDQNLRDCECDGGDHCQGDCNCNYEP